MHSKCYCGSTKTHNGNKKLADEHSKIAQSKFLEERARFLELNGAPIKEKAVILPFFSETGKTGARLLL